MEREKALAYAKKHRAKLAVLALLLLFAALKISTINAGYINRDEPLYAWQSLVMYKHPELIFSKEVNYWYVFALIPAIAAPLNAFLEPHVAIRVVVLGFSVLSLMFAYLIGRRLFSETAGVFAAAFLVLSPVFHFHSNIAMPDTPIIALGLVVMYLLITSNKKRLLLIPPTVLVMYLIRASSLVVVLPIAVFLLAKYRKRIDTKKIVISVAALALIVLVGFAFSPYQWLSIATMLQGMDYFWFFIMFAYNFFIRMTGIPMALFAIVGIIRYGKKPDLDRGLLSLWALLTTVPFLVVKSPMDRYYLSSIPCLAIMAGAGAASIIENKNYPLGLAMVVAFVVFLLMTPPYATFLYNEYIGTTQKPNLKHMVLEEFLRSNVSEGDTVIIISDEYIGRSIRLSAEKSLPDPREQVMIVPTKQAFEETVEEKGNFFVIYDDYTADILYTSEKTFIRKFYIKNLESWDNKELSLEEYLISKGFEEVKEVTYEKSSLSEDFFVYKKENKE